MTDVLQNDLRSLDNDMCEELLSRHDTGRFIYYEWTWPEILPTKYRFDDTQIVMRLEHGATLKNVPMSPTAFEVDSFDPHGQWGWSVIARGYVTDITDEVADPSGATRAVPIWPTAPGDSGHCLSLRVRQLTGRFFGSPPELRELSSRY